MLASAKFWVFYYKKCTQNDCHQWLSHSFAPNSFSTPQGEWTAFRSLSWFKGEQLTSKGNGREWGDGRDVREGKGNLLLSCSRALIETYCSSFWPIGYLLAFERTLIYRIESYPIVSWGLHRCTYSSMTSLLEHCRRFLADNALWSHQLFCSFDSAAASFYSQFGL